MPLELSEFNNTQWGSDTLRCRVVTTKCSVAYAGKDVSSFSAQYTGQIIPCGVLSYVAQHMLQLKDSLIQVYIGSPYLFSEVDATNQQWLKFGEVIRECRNLEVVEIEADAPARMLLRSSFRPIGELTKIRVEGIRYDMNQEEGNAVLVIVLLVGCHNFPLPNDLIRLLRAYWYF